MTTAVIHQRPLRGHSDWGKCAWLLLRVEMTKAREHVAKGEPHAAKSHLREARDLSYFARRWDRGLPRPRIRN
jgi:hypothetical protein